MDEPTTAAQIEAVAALLGISPEGIRVEPEPSAAGDEHGPG